jgi:4-amino-4-deoxy-L-arabinose transferase-like glycosyltransferase
VTRFARATALAAVLAGALSLRLAVLFELCRGPFSPTAPVFYLPVDAREYHAGALAWLSGAWPPPEAFFRPPLYTIFVGAIYAAAGPHPVAVLAVQAVLGTAACGLAYAIARELFANRAVALIAAAFCAVSGTLLHEDAQLLSGSLDVFLSLLFVCLLLGAARRERIGGYAAAGTALALAILNRGSGLLALPFVLAWIAFAARGAPGARALARGLAVLGPVVALLAPVALHNVRYDEDGGQPLPAREMLTRLASGGFVLLAANSGINLYLGNHAALRPYNRIDHPEHLAVYDRVRLEPTRRGLTSSAAKNRYLVQETLRHVRSEPGEWLALVARKTADLLNGVEIARNTSLYADRRHSRVLRALLWKAGSHGPAFPSGFLIPLGLVGIGLVGGGLLRREGSAHRLVIGLLALQGLFVVAFFVTERYRLPMLPLFAIYAASALVTLARRTRAGGARAAARPALAAAALLVACNLGGGPVARTHSYAEYQNLAVARFEHGDLAGAEVAWERALRRNPEHVDSLVGVCKARVDLGRAPEALAPCERAVSLAPGSAAARLQLGLTLEALGRRAEAASQVRRAAELAPESATPRRALRRLLAPAAAAPRAQSEDPAPP